MLSVVWSSWPQEQVGVGASLELWFLCEVGVVASLNYGSYVKSVLVPA